MWFNRTAFFVLSILASEVTYAVPVTTNTAPLQVDNDGAHQLISTGITMFRTIDDSGDIENTVRAKQFAVSKSLLGLFQLPSSASTSPNSAGPIHYHYIPTDSSQTRKPSFNAEHERIAHAAVRGLFEEYKRGVVEEPRRQFVGNPADFAIQVTSVIEVGESVKCPCIVWVGVDLTQIERKNEYPVMGAFKSLQPDVPEVQPKTAKLVGY